MEIEGRKCSLFDWRNMDKVKRPKKVQRADKNYLSNEKYQDYAEEQFKTIYDKLDEIIEKLNN